MFSIAIVPQEAFDLDENLYYTHDVSLKLQYQGLSLTFEPENTEVIFQIDISKNIGCIDTRPSNAQFALTWSPELITIVCGRYGDGNGGSVEMSVKSTPELLKSLQKSLKVWKEAVEKVRKYI